jgi:hypothetical protein
VCSSAIVRGKSNTRGCDMAVPISELGDCRREIGTEGEGGGRWESG